MATHHAKSNEVVDLKTWANDLPTPQTKVILKSNQLEIARLVLPKGKAFRQHRVSGPITVHCIEGEFIFNAEDKEQLLSKDQLIYLASDVPHSLTAKTDSIVLLTIVFKPG